jgi:hypothetical protein
MSDTGFQLPLASYETLVRIILSYYHAGADKEPVPVSAVAQRMGMSRPGISSNNNFLVLTAILEKADRGYVFTQDGLELAKALAVYREDITAPEVGSAWRGIVERNEFLRRAPTAVRVRGRMDVDAFARHIVLTSGAPPDERRFITGARTVIAVLRSAGFLTEDDSRVVEAADGKPRVELQNAHGDTSLQPRPGTINSTTTAVTVGIPLSIMLTVPVTADTSESELREIGERIRLLWRIVQTDGAANEEAGTS